MLKLRVLKDKITEQTQDQTLLRLQGSKVMQTISYSVQVEGNQFAVLSAFLDLTVTLLDSHMAENVRC